MSPFFLQLFKPEFVRYVPFCHYFLLSYVSVYFSVGTPAIPAATVEFASLCLRNAWLLLSKVPEASATAQPQSDDKDDG